MITKLWMFDYMVHRNKDLISACHLERRLELAKTEVETRRATTEWSDLAVSRLRNALF